MLFNIPCNCFGTHGQFESDDDFHEMGTPGCARNPEKHKMNRLAGVSTAALIEELKHRGHYVAVKIKAAEPDIIVPISAAARMLLWCEYSGGKDKVADAFQVIQDQICDVTSQYEIEYWK